MASSVLPTWTNPNTQEAEDRRRRSVRRSCSSTHIEGMEGDDEYWWRTTTHVIIALLVGLVISGYLHGRLRARVRRSAFDVSIRAQELQRFHATRSGRLDGFDPVRIVRGPAGARTDVSAHTVRRPYHRNPYPYPTARAIA